MPPQRNGIHKLKEGMLPSLDSMREDDLTELIDSLVESKEKRRQIWQDEMTRMGTIPKEEGDNDDDDDKTITRNHLDQIDGVSPLVSLKSILAAAISPKSASVLQHQSPSSSNQSGSSTPSRSQLTASSSTVGGRTPNEDLVSVQMVYQAAFCFWLFSFDEEIANEINAKFDLIPLLGDVARNAVKEKIVRVIVATLRNLAEKAPNVNISAMLGCKCLPLMESLAARKWSDEEIMQDIEAVKEILADKLKGMSNFDQYITEVASGRLTWDNPAHSLDEFWKENTNKLLESSANEDHSNQSGLSMLISLIAKEDSDSPTLAIACNDIGKIITFSPEMGKKRIEKEGGKAKVMQLMTHSDGEVKFYALNTVSRLVSASWRG